MVVVAATADDLRRMASVRLSDAAFVGVSALLFAGSTTLTIVWCASMSAMGDADARRLDDVDGVDADAQSDVAQHRASFLGMWVVMMMAMMVPSLVPSAAGGTARPSAGQARRAWAR